MANETFSLHGTQLTHPPMPMKVWWDKHNVIHKLADGSIREYIKGYKLIADIRYQENWINSGDYATLLAASNDTSDLSFVPRPNVSAGATATFTVRWTNAFEFTYHKGQFGYWGGKIKLEGVSVTATAGSLI